MFIYAQLNLDRSLQKIADFEISTNTFFLIEPKKFLFIGWSNAGYLNEARQHYRASVLTNRESVIFWWMD